MQDARASFDFVWYDGDPMPDVNEAEPNSHGTSCAGEIAMGRNCSCGVGVAHDCSIAGGQCSIKMHSTMYLPKSSI